MNTLRTEEDEAIEVGAKDKIPLEQGREIRLYQTVPIRVVGPNKEVETSMKSHGVQEVFKDSSAELCANIENFTKPDCHLWIVQCEIVKAVDRMLDIEITAETSFGKTFAIIIALLRVQEKHLRSLQLPVYEHSTIVCRLNIFNVIMHPQVIILVPTVPLADEIFNIISMLSNKTPIIPAKVRGGSRRDNTFSSLGTQPADCNLLVACTATLKQMIDHGSVVLDRLQFLWIDEFHKFLDQVGRPGKGQQYDLSDIFLSSNDSKWNITRDGKDVRTIISDTDKSSATKKLSAQFFKEDRKREITLATPFLDNRDYFYMTLPGSDEVEDKSTHPEPSTEHIKFLNAVAEAVSTHEKLQGKTLLFLPTRADQDYMLRRLIALCPNRLTYSTNCKLKEREAAFEAFAASPGTAICISSVVAGIGINIPGLDTVAMTYVTELESFISKRGRGGRLGQEGNVVQFFAQSTWNALENVQEHPTYFQLALTWEKIRTTMQTKSITFTELKFTPTSCNQAAAVANTASKRSPQPNAAPVTQDTVHSNSRSHAPEANLRNEQLSYQSNSRGRGGRTGSQEYTRSRAETRHAGPIRGRVTARGRGSRGTLSQSWMATRLGYSG